jgi:putative salt-induced outer membrane protein
MKTRHVVSSLALAGLVLVALPARAQEPCPPCPPPAPPTPDWTGSLGAGLALTGGNSDTKSYNLSFSALHDPKRKNVFKAEGLYLRSDTGGEPTVNRSSLGARDEYRLGTGRAFVFGEGRFQRDVFKEVDYLISPLAGVGYKLVDQENLKLLVDGALGGAFEKLTGHDATSSGALQAGQSFSVKISGNTSLRERASGLWKTSDFDDAYYRVEAGLLTSVSRRIELRLSYLLDYKNKPADPTLVKADTSFVVALVYKIG